MSGFSKSGFLKPFTDTCPTVTSNVCNRMPSTYANLQTQSSITDCINTCLPNNSDQSKKCDNGTMNQITSCVDNYVNTHGIISVPNYQLGNGNNITCPTKLTLDESNNKLVYYIDDKHNVSCDTNDLNSCMNPKKTFKNVSMLKIHNQSSDQSSFSGDYQFTDRIACWCDTNSSGVCKKNTSYSLCRYKAPGVTDNFINLKMDLKKSCN